ncbi:MAG TPA: thioredoxin family protein [Terracidiphilus sp.]|nr:thioredoxin family protein [Terracidiphilus sp.]
MASTPFCLCAAHGLLIAQAASSAPEAPAAAQSSPASLPAPTDTVAPPKSPADLYREAMHPLELVRQSLDNWSDAELGALGVGMHMANEDCAQAKPELYKGDDLYDLARLCAFGQNWEGANDAALAYIASREEEHRVQSYAISISSLFHMGAVDLAVQTARGMLGYPYDAESAYALRDLKNNLAQASNPAVLPLAETEHPLIVTALKQGTPLKAVHGDAVIGLGALYESAMQLAFLDRYAGNDEAAAAAFADVQAALPAAATLTAEDHLRIDAATRRYQLLGMHLPEVKILRALQSPAARAQIDQSFASATVLVLFSDWCAECRNMMKTLTRFAELNRNTPIHAYGLVFADDSVILGEQAHEQNLKQLAGTQTLVVPATAVQALGATDYPLGIVLDTHHTIRFVGTLPSDAFNGDGYIPKVIVNMVKTAHAAPKLNAKRN